jgi:hypothetical protein
MIKRLVWIFVATAMLAGAEDKQAAANTNTELTVYLLSGSPQGTADDVPQDLGPTVKQLHSIFAYKSYKLNESFILRGRSGNASTEGILPGSGLHYRFGYRRIQVLGEAPRAVHIDGLSLSLSKPVVAPDGHQGLETVASISTDLDIREGQKTVVGKSSVSSTGDALILVIVPKLVD